MEKETQENIERENWTEAVEDLVHEGDIDKAITLLETIVSKLHHDENHKDSLQLSAALLDLSKLYSTKSLSLKADHASSRALLIKQQSLLLKLESNEEKELPNEGVTGDRVSRDESLARGEISGDGSRIVSGLQNEASTHDGASDDDWEAIADRGPDELLSAQSLPGISELSLQDSKVQSSKRRGRGTFSYKTQGLYSDQQSDDPVHDDSEESLMSHTSEATFQTGNLEYGTRHVLVLAGFPPSTKTRDLEKLFTDFKDHGVVIRWVSDTVALAVFRSPALALEASNCVQFPFTVRVLDDKDELLGSIPPKDLEPPRPRPKTSARTAQRLIAQSMGLKLPSTSFGSRELRKQEEARKNRIVARQHMRDDAWGDD